MYLNISNWSIPILRIYFRLIIDQNRKKYKRVVLLFTLLSCENISCSVTITCNFRLMFGYSCAIMNKDLRLERLKSWIISLKNLNFIILKGRYRYIVSKPLYWYLSIEFRDIDILEEIFGGKIWWLIYGILLNFS